MPQKPRTARGAVLNVAAAIEPDADGGLPKGEVAAYVFSAGGKLLETAPLDAKGGAALKVPVPAEPTGARVMVGPRLEKPDLTELLRRGAVEAHVRLEPKEIPNVDFTIGPDIWPCWFLGRCTVPGTVLKRTIHDGEPLDLPVCGATVEIYEVDPIWVIVPRLPDHVIELIREEIVRPHPIPDPPPEIRRLALPPMPEPLAFAARSASVAQLRRQLVLNPEIVRLILCYIRPHFVTKTLIGTATTDECGHFRFTFFRGCHNPDQPDLYFVVKQPWFFGLEFTIYEPTPVYCYTHWDYACGTEVTIHTSSPFARTCAPCPPLDPGGVDNYVAVMHVGNTLTSNIQGVRAGVPVTTGRGLTVDGRPFGGTLNPHLEFDPQLRDSLGVRYYRVTVQRPGGAGARALDAPCRRHFRHAVAGGEVVEPYQLGPVTINGTPHLFEIPPSVPPIGVWSTPDPYEDQANAKWDSTMEAPGVDDAAPDKAGEFELKIELFDVNGAPVNTAALGIGWLVPRETSVSGAMVLHLDPPDPSCVAGSAFLLPLHVDNNHCRATIGDPELNGSSVADVCGVMRYTPPVGTAGNVVLPYRASHRNGHADYSFTVKRGVNPLTPPSTSGPVGAGTFAPVATVAHLMGPCTLGAFLEELYVAARATDGWSRLSGYDASGSRAFALAPH
jgi:hypothetical protein